MRDPLTPEEWLAVAHERGGDATAMLPARAMSIGPLYMAGYAVVSALKAYLKAKKIPRPERGSGGHNLRALWKSSGLQLRDLNDTDGSAAFFIEEWTTALRYQTKHSSSQQKSETIVNTAKRLVGYISKLSKRRK